MSILHMKLLLSDTLNALYMVKFLIKRPIAVLMAFTACFIVGLVTYFSLPVSLLPDVDIPQITVQVSGENSSARELENTMVAPVRRRLCRFPD